MAQRQILIAGLTLILGACGGIPQSAGNVPTSAPRPAAVSNDTRACLASLNASGSNFSAMPDRFYGAGCATVNTVQLSAVRGDRSQFGVSNIGPVGCPTANTFAAWARYGVDRAARQILRSPLARIETMGSYSCRNVAGSSRRSAHSVAAAIDVAAFILADGRRISVQSDWDGGSRKEREFLRIIHRSACKRFGTVLGPDYNTAHRDHFHLETQGEAFCR
jgi:hypothetical protein